MQFIEGKATTLVIPQEILDLTEVISKRHNIRQSQALRSLLFLGSDLYKDMEKVGLPQTVGFISKLQVRLKKQRLFGEGKVIEQFITE